MKQGDIFRKLNDFPAAQRAYEDIISAEVDPSLYDRVMRRDEHDRLKAEIDAAAELNGLDPDDMYRQAGYLVRGRYYSEFWELLDKRDMPGAERVARILVELGVAPGDALSSGERRGVSQESLNEAARLMGTSLRRLQRPRNPNQRERRPTGR